MIHPAMIIMITTHDDDIRVMITAVTSPGRGSAGVTLEVLAGAFSLKLLIMSPDSDGGHSAA